MWILRGGGRASRHPRSRWFTHGGGGGDNLFSDVGIKVLMVLINLLPQQQLAC